VKKQIHSFGGTDVLLICINNLVKSIFTDLERKEMFAYSEGNSDQYNKESIPLNILINKRGIYESGRSIELIKKYFKGNINPPASEASGEFRIFIRLLVFSRCPSICDVF